MRTRSQSCNNFPQQEALPAIIEPLLIEIPFFEDQFQEDPPVDPPEVPLADNRTMAELLQAPTEVVAKVSTSSSTPAISSEVSELKDMVRALLLDKKNQSSAPASSSTPAPVKAIEPNCITCVTGWRVCIDYRKLNEAIRKDHFPLPFMDQMLERLAGNEFYCFLDGFSGYFQIPIDPRDQEKTTFTCPYGTFAYRRMPFGLSNAPGTFQRCMLAIFHDMVEKTMEVFMDDFSVFGNSFENCLSRLDKMLQRCEDTNLSLNWEKSHFMVKEGIVLGHKIYKSGLRLTEPKSMSLLNYLIPQPSK
nr:reverse transcriptase domain-containing protein [Tanacetum cinerariifolium]